MSRIGKKPVPVPAGVKVEVNGNQVSIGGSGGTLTLNVRAEIAVQYDAQAGRIVVTRQSDQRLHRALHGTTRALIANMIQGVTQGFARSLKIFGTGYGISVKGQEISLSVGFAKPAVLPIPPGVAIEIKTPNTRGNEIPAEFTVRGPDKWAVGQFAAAIRQVRPPEPYLGKGIRYAEEQIKRKVGKAFASGG
ncbi:MAG: 50S ribosomal protein L6 [Sedimentisphaerales bacterium]|nr:50S ribosomal protein L6 [Sedimentisphaerales bacterium]